MLKHIKSHIKFSVKSTLSMLVFVTNGVFAQGFNFNSSRELGIYGGNLLWGGLNTYLTYKVEPVQHPFPKFGIDNYHVSTSNQQIKTASDISFWSCAILSGVLTLKANQSVDWNMANTLLQNTVITANLTQTVKLFAGRKRPSTWGGNDDLRSFFSGHSSLTASAATTALYYAYNIPDAPKYAKGIGWTAAGLSILTGILRIESGKHYPTDVITGLIIGSGVALLNSHIHRPR